MPIYGMQGWTVTAKTEKRYSISTIVFTLWIRPVNYFLPPSQIWTYYLPDMKWMHMWCEYSWEKTPINGPESKLPIVDTGGGCTVIKMLGYDLHSKVKLCKSFLGKKLFEEIIRSDKKKCLPTDPKRKENRYNRSPASVFLYLTVKSLLSCPSLKMVAAQ